mgnify:CR=1 FL=1
MSKIECSYVEQLTLQACTNVCLEYTGLTIITQARHRHRTMKFQLHRNEIPLKDILEMAVKEGDGDKIIEMLEDIMEPEKSPGKKVKVKRRSAKST